MSKEKYYDLHYYLFSIQVEKWSFWTTKSLLISVCGGAVISCDRFCSLIRSLNKKNIAELSNSWQTKKQSYRNLTFKKILYIP